MPGQALCLRVVDYHIMEYKFFSVLIYIWLRLGGVVFIAFIFFLGGVLFCLLVWGVVVVWGFCLFF